MRITIGFLYWLLLKNCSDAACGFAVVTRRVGTTTLAMESGAARVGEIESVSAGIDNALSAITLSAEQTRTAATGLGEAAGQNVSAVNDAAAGISAAARAAETP